MKQNNVTLSNKKKWLSLCIISHIETLSAWVVVKIDNVVITYFKTQKKLTKNKPTWKDFLAEVDYMLEYKSGKVNLMDDALSQRLNLLWSPQQVGTFKML